MGSQDLVLLPRPCLPRILLISFLTFQVDIMRQHIGAMNVVPNNPEPMVYSGAMYVIGGRALRMLVQMRQTSSSMFACVAI